MQVRFGRVHRNGHGSRTKACALVVTNQLELGEGREASKKEFTRTPGGRMMRVRTGARAYVSPWGWQIRKAPNGYEIMVLDAKRVFSHWPASSI